MKKSPDLVEISRNLALIMFVSGFSLKPAHAEEGLFLLYGDEDIVSI